jgi:stage II sporulation protein P
VIFLAVVLLTRTGAAATLEQKLADVLARDALTGTLLGLALPETPADSPAPEAAATAATLLPPEAEAETDAEDAPTNTLPSRLPSIPPPDDDIAAHLPEPSVYESLIPGLTAGLTATTGDVTAVSISGDEGGYTGGGTVYIRNETDYAIDPAALLKGTSPVKLSGTGVQVLIMHTHGTEAYTPDAENPYTPTDADRTTDAARNVLRVGDEITRILEANGVKTVHSNTLNDYPAYNGSYNRALDDISQFMKDNPSIKVVIDVHRDAMIAQSGAKYKTVADIGGKQAAQLMFVAGTDAGGRSHDRWRDNLTFQALLHSRMNTKYPGIMRPISIRTGRFNQHVTTGSMLLEVGTSGNTLPEALYSAGLFAQELADMLNGR